MTHKEHFLHAHNLPEGAYSLKQLSKISHVPMSILQEVYNRGIGAYKTNPSSVRLKGSYVKGVKAPMSAKLSKEQWAMARVYSFLDGNPKHDNDLRASKRGGGPSQSLPTSPPVDYVQLAIRLAKQNNTEMNNVVVNSHDRSLRFPLEIGRELDRVTALIPADDWALPSTLPLIELIEQIGKRRDAFNRGRDLLVEANRLINFGNYVTPVTTIAMFDELNATYKFSKSLKNFGKNVLTRLNTAKKSPRIPYNESMSEDQCNICLENFDEESMIRILPCKHKFHVECWNEWVSKNDPLQGLKATCPVCRKPSGLGKPRKCRKCGGVKQIRGGVEHNELVEKIRQLNNMYPNPTFEQAKQIQIDIIKFILDGLTEEQHQAYWPQISSMFENMMSFIEQGNLSRSNDILLDIYRLLWPSHVMDIIRRLESKRPIKE